MATKLLFQRWQDGRFSASAEVIVDHCPWADLDGEQDRNPQVLRLLAEGYKLSGHIDGVRAGCGSEAV